MLHNFRNGSCIFRLAGIRIVQSAGQFFYSICGIYIKPPVMLRHTHGIFGILAAGNQNGSCNRRANDGRAFGKHIAVFFAQLLDGIGQAVSRINGCAGHRLHALLYQGSGAGHGQRACRPQADKACRAAPSRFFIISFCFNQHTGRLFQSVPKLHFGCIRIFFRQPGFFAGVGNNRPYPGRRRFICAVSDNRRTQPRR